MFCSQNYRHQILPLFSKGICAAKLFARYIGRAGSAMLTTIIMFMNVILTCIMFYKISVCGRLYFINIGTWISSDSFQVNWSFYLNNLPTVVTFLAFYPLGVLLTFLFSCAATVCPLALGPMAGSDEVIWSESLDNLRFFLRLNSWCG